MLPSEISLLFTYLLDIFMVTYRLLFTFFLLIEFAVYFYFLIVCRVAPTKAEIEDGSGFKMIDLTEGNIVRCIRLYYFSIINNNHLCFNSIVFLNLK